jgi:putative CocE/NonD family hydrolase
VSVSDGQLRAEDGCRLCHRLWLPEGTGPWPVLLMRQPYGRAIASTVTYAHPHWYASQGFAVLVQDVRGRGDSDGEFGGFVQEAADASRTLRWLRQQPWCNGRVGTYGFSYQGLSQLLWADEEVLPDALASAMAGLDERLHWASEGGAHWWAIGVAWALQLAAQGCRRRGDGQGWQQIRAALADGSFLEQGLALLERYDRQGMGLNWLQRDPAGRDGWRRHEPPTRLWRQPMLLVGGWYDPHLNGVLDLWRRSEAGGGQPVLRIGAWSHLHWQGGIDRQQLAFFQQQLQRSDQGEHAPGPSRAPRAESPAALLQDLRSQHWLARRPDQTTGQRWGLASAGLAAVDATEGLLQDNSGGSLVLVHDPWRPLPGRGGHLGLDAGPAERTDLDARCDVACFTGRPLEADLELLGRPVLILQAAADQPGFDLCAALSVVDSSGAVQQLSTGVARFRGAGCQRQQPCQVQLQPLLATLRAGERLRLSIGLAAWPQIAVNPGDGSLPQGPAGPAHRVISVQLELTEAALCMHAMVGAN